MLIRQAREKDDKQLVDWTMAFWTEMDTPFPIEREHVEKVIKGTREKQVMLVAEDKGELKGFIAGVYVPHFLNPKLVVLQEIGWYVPKEHRHSRAGWALLKAFTKVGEMKRVHYTSISTMAKSPISDRHLEKVGYKRMETAYIRKTGE